MYLSSYSEFFRKAHKASNSYYAVTLPSSGCREIKSKGGKFRIFTFIKSLTYLDTLLIPKATCWLRDKIIFSFFLICI